MKFEWNIISKQRDAIFGFSIVWVMLFHGTSRLGLRYFKGIPVLSIFGKFLKHGNMGVDVFLLLSGVGLYFAFVKNSDLKRFYYRRFIRLLLPLMLIGWPYWAYRLSTGALTVSEFILNCATLSFWIDGRVHIWFVSAIAVFYLLYPLIYRILFTWGQGKLRVVAGMILMWVVLLFLWRAAFPESYDLIEIALTRVPIFLAGCWIAKCVHENRESTGKFWWVALCTTCIGFTVLFEKWIDDLTYKRWLYGITAFGFTFLLALVFRYAPEVIVKAFDFTGKMSLELYLSHTVVLRLYKLNVFSFDYQEKNLLHFAILMVISYIVAVVACQIKEVLLARVIMKRPVA